MKFREIFLKAFSKAEKDTAASAKTQWARHIANELWEAFKYQVNEKTLRNYYDSYSYGDKGPETQPKAELVEALCKYIGFDSYATYLNETSKEGAKKRTSIISDKVWITTLVIISLFMANIIFNRDKQECMIWKINHYEITECTGERAVIQLDKETLEGMHQLFGLCTESTFFLPDDSPVVWYDKYHNKLTFFTMPGLHPTNGRTLKPISQYIIDKYTSGACD